MSYRKIGDLIQLVDIRNKDLSITNLVGLTINKKFIPSVANTIGTDMSNYKIIRKNQFACSIMQVRRDKNAYCIVERIGRIYYFTGLSCF